MCPRGGEVINVRRVGGRMDRAMKNLLARVAGALALGALLLHAGQHVERTWPGGDLPWGAWAGIALLLVVTVAASWAQARLNAKRAALWTASVLLGALPVAAFLLHRAPPEDGYGVVLLLGLLFGAATLAFTGWLLADRRDPSPDARA